MPSTTEVSPENRLAITRNAILRHMNRGHRLGSMDGNVEMENGGDGSRNGLMGAWDTVRDAALIWWDRHPASAVLELTRPLMSEYARLHPFQLLGISVLAGGVVVLARPWRMMSVGSWIVAAVKSSGMTSAVISLLTKPGKNR